MNQALWQDASDETVHNLAYRHLQIPYQSNQVSLPATAPRPHRDLVGRNPYVVRIQTIIHA